MKNCEAMNVSWVKLSTEKGNLSSGKRNRKQEIAFHVDFLEFKELNMKRPTEAGYFHMSFSYSETKFMETTSIRFN